MKLTFLAIGKQYEDYVGKGVELFTKRINHYFPASWKLIAAPRLPASAPEIEWKKKEAETILDFLKPEDFLVALDEKGKSFTSETLAGFINQRTNEGCRHLVFVIGGAFGLHTSVLERSNAVWSLSALTFPHQLVRLLLAEQVYRACTILRNEKYHHK